MTKTGTGLWLLLWHMALLLTFHCKASLRPWQPQQTRKQNPAWFAEGESLEIFGELLDAPEGNVLYFECPMHVFLNYLSVYPSPPVHPEQELCWSHCHITTPENTGYLHEPGGLLQPFVTAFKFSSQEACPDFSRGFPLPGFILPRL